jgi:hypothetical protein
MMGDAVVPYDAGTVPPSHEGYWLNFDGAELTVHAPNGEVTHRFDAVSGIPGSSASDQAKESFGPIPEGTYKFESSDLVAGSPDGPKSYFQDWGNYHVPVNPTGGTNTLGRSGFEIHGGLKRGSKGCIDIGPSAEALYDALKDIEGPIFLTVHYDNPNAFHWVDGDEGAWGNLWDIPGGIPQWEDWRRPAPDAADPSPLASPDSEITGFDMESDAASRGFDMEADAVAGKYDMRSDMATDLDPSQQASPGFDMEADAAGSGGFDMEADAAAGIYDMRSDTATDLNPSQQASPGFDMEADADRPAPGKRAARRPR